MNPILSRVLFLFALTASLFISGCEDEAAAEENALVSDSFNISRVDVKSTGLYKNDEILNNNQCETIYWKTVHSHIKRKVHTEKALAGFE